MAMIVIEIKDTVPTRVYVGLVPTMPLYSGWCMLQSIDGACMCFSLRFRHLFQWSKGYEMCRFPGIEESGDRTKGLEKACRAFVRKPETGV